MKGTTQDQDQEDQQDQQQDGVAESAGDDVAAALTNEQLGAGVQTEADAHSHDHGSESRDVAPSSDSLSANGTSPPSSKGKRKSNTKGKQKGTSKSKSRSKRTSQGKSTNTSEDISTSADTSADTDTNTSTNTSTNTNTSTSASKRKSKGKGKSKRKAKDKRPSKPKDDDEDIDVGIAVDVGNTVPSESNADDGDKDDTETINDVEAQRRPRSQKRSKKGKTKSMGQATKTITTNATAAPNTATPTRTYTTRHTDPDRRPRHQKIADKSKYACVAGRSSANQTYNQKQMARQSAVESMVNRRDALQKKLNVTDGATSRTVPQLTSLNASDTIFNVPDDLDDLDDFLGDDAIAKEKIFHSGNGTRLNDGATNEKLSKEMLNKRAGAFIDPDQATIQRRQQLQIESSNYILNQDKRGNSIAAADDFSGSQLHLFSHVPSDVVSPRLQRDHTDFDNSGPPLSPTQLLASRRLQHTRVGAFRSNGPGTVPRSLDDDFEEDSIMGAMTTADHDVDTNLLQQTQASQRPIVAQARVVSDGELRQQLRDEIFPDDGLRQQLQSEIARASAVQPVVAEPAELDSAHEVEGGEPEDKRKTRTRFILGTIACIVMTLVVIGGLIVMIFILISGGSGGDSGGSGNDGNLRTTIAPITTAITTDAPTTALPPSPDVEIPDVQLTLFNFLVSESVTSAETLRDAESVQHRTMAYICQPSAENPPTLPFMCSSPLSRPFDSLQSYALLTFYIENDMQDALANRSVFVTGICDWPGVVECADSGMNNEKTIIAIDFAEQGLAGTIPPELGELSQIQFANLSHNELSGKLPTTFQSLRNSRGMDLSHNQFTGELSISVAAGSPLEYAYWHNNSFSGPVDACDSQKALQLDISADCRPLDASSPAEVECPCCSLCCNDATGCISQQPSA